MVGVPGRSKGCHACRRRKKGCDLGRPACARCLQVGIECDGYERKRIFIHTDPTPASTASKPKVLPPPPAAAGLNDAHVAVSQLQPIEAVFSTSLVRSASRVACIATLWELQSPNEHACEMSTIIWITKVQHKPIFQQSPSLQKSVLAVCLTSIGKEYKTEWIIQYGLQLYGAAIKTLSAALSRLPPSTPPSDAMLVTTRVLAIHELISRGGIGGCHDLHKIHAWPTHKLGELALLTARPPDTFVDEPSHDMFIDARFMCTVAATLARQGTVLSSPDWKTVPWSKRLKSPRDLLVDIFVDVPSLLQQLDTAMDCTDKFTKRTLSDRCLERATTCERSLMDWLETYAPKGWGILGCPSLDHSNATPDDIKDAHLMCLFWATYTLVLTVACSLPTSPADANTTSRKNTMLACCQSTARTIPVVFMGRAAAVSCYQIASFPMFFALEGLMSIEAPNVSEDQLRLLALFMKPARGGGSLADFVMGLLEHSPVYQQTEAAKAIIALASERWLTQSG